MDYFRSKRFLDMLPDWESGSPIPGPSEHYLPRVRALLSSHPLMSRMLASR